MSNVTDPEPAPRDSGGPDIVDLVKADLDDRRRVGIETYGKPLRTFNGRRPLRDAYAEDLDRIQYLRQEIEEREILADLLDTAASQWDKKADDVAGGVEIRYAEGMADGLRRAACLIRGHHPEAGELGPEVTQ
jgi:hypothetical protein